jgi:anti-repressor protein
MGMQLITLHTRSINEQTLNTVNARELHTFLELGRDFSNWIKARIAQYGFEEGEDFIFDSPKCANQKSGR